MTGYTRHADVVVMTPEKLASRLRANEQELLDEFGLFVLDEAHLVADGDPWLVLREYDLDDCTH